MGGRRGARDGGGELSAEDWGLSIPSNAAGWFQAQPFVPRLHGRGAT